MVDTPSFSYAYYGSKLVYPNFLSKVDTDVFKDGEEKYVRKVAEYACEHGYNVSTVVVVLQFHHHGVNNMMFCIVTQAFIPTHT